MTGWHGRFDALFALVKAGAGLVLRRRAGLTPRTLADLYGFEEIVRFIEGGERTWSRNWCFRGRPSRRGVN